MAAVDPLLAAASSMTLQLWLIGAAALVVYVRGPGPAAWRRAWDRRRHPARTPRFLAGVFAVAATAVVVVAMAITTEPRPPRPRATVAVVEDPDRGTRRASFVLYDPVPGGAESLTPDALSGASY